MATLSDRSIREAIENGQIKVDPYDPTMIQPATLDLRCGHNFRVFESHKVASIDLNDPPVDLTQEENVEDGEPFVLHPQEFVLGTTLETVGLPDNIQAHVGGKSSLGRLGLIVHATAGVIDAGFEGQITLELTNLTRVPIFLYANKPIAQLSFFQLDRPAERPYGHKELGSHYFGQTGATASRYSGQVEN